MIKNRQVFEYQNQILIEKVTIKPPFRYEAIFQNEGCFIYVTGASSKIQSSEENFNIKNKEAVLFKCGTYFVDWLKNSENCTVEVIAVHLYPSILKKLYHQELPQLIKHQNSTTRAQKIVPDNTISKFIDNLNFYFQTPSLVNDDLLELKIKELILLLIQTNNAESVLQLLETLFTPRVVKLKDIVNKHLYSSFSIEELAKLCNLSLSSFKREFKKVFNDTPANYINSKKIKKATELLKLSDLSINDIAYEIGFNDPSYFTRIFKNKTDYSPTAFRKKEKSELKIQK